MKRRIIGSLAIFAVAIIIELLTIHKLALFAYSIGAQLLAVGFRDFSSYNYFEQGVFMALYCMATGATVLIPFTPLYSAVAVQQIFFGSEVKHNAE